ncbi:DUF58 domain-containing protein [Natrinema versiforme]|uniref:DUF58 domain-containing protein n=1 Tax=Natrinema versiforme TaxID=88724 RepID=A0A4P8WMR0_9EURY|nr:DUF58 domain-containing protein [Natrinema versiforme]QCS44887.1 DUF58 domain-containing protein [Natrinema versiforme]
MRVTRHLWGCVSLAGFLAALAVVLERPLLLAGVALIGAWLLATQSAFLAALERTRRGLSVTRSMPSSSVRADESVPVTLAATLADPAPLHLDVDAGLPTATKTADGDATAVAVEPETTGAERTAVASWPVVGTHAFDPARVTATDGRFRETFAAGGSPTVSVESRGPQAIHVGEGGDRLTSVYGDHALRRSGRGLEPSELREHVPGDAAKRIDWKATARLATPHVREYETETTRRTLLVVDHRRPLASGPPSETKLDYLREVMLATAENARDSDDPLGLRCVGDRGVTTDLEPAATAEAYATIRRELLDVEPTPATPSPQASTAHARPQATDGGRSETPRATRDDAGPSPSVHGGATRRTARHSVRDLEGDTDPFAETLRPFYAESRRDSCRDRDRPLSDAVRTSLASSVSATRTIVFTDDSDPAEVRETVSLARRNDSDVTVFLAPSVLYEPGGLDDIERAYERYREFESLRRDLGRLEGVRAFEVGPADRLGTVLEAARDRGGRR